QDLKEARRGPSPPVRVCDVARLLDRAAEERLMPAASVSAATIERLSRIESAGESVLSVYLDLDPARFPTPGARDVELSALLGRAGARGADAKRVREALNADPELARGAPSIAIFSCAAAGILEVVARPEPVEPLAVVDSAPWLEPLAAIVARRTGASPWLAGVRRACSVVGRRDSLSSRSSGTICIDVTRRAAGPRRASSAESRGR